MDYQLATSMSPQIAHLIQTYGYWLMAFGAIVEGETFLVAGGIAAHKGFFHLEGLILLAIVGSTLHDCCFFFLGRFFGHEIVKRRPNLYKRADRILALFEKYGVGIIIVLRFAYGLRTIIPTVIGMTKISALKFIFYDVIGGVLWSTTFIVGGYIFGSAVDAFLQTLNLYTQIPFYLLIVGVLLAGLVFTIIFRIRKKKKRA